MAYHQLRYRSSHAKDSVEDRGTADSHEALDLAVHIVDKIVVGEFWAFSAAIVERSSQKHDIRRTTTIKLAIDPGTGVQDMGLLVRHNEAETIERVGKFGLLVGKIDDGGGSVGDPRQQRPQFRINPSSDLSGCMSRSSKNNIIKLISKTVTLDDEATSRSLEKQFRSTPNHRDVGEFLLQSFDQARHAVTKAEEDRGAETESGQWSQTPPEASSPLFRSVELWHSTGYGKLAEFCAENGSYEGFDQAIRKFCTQSSSKEVTGT